MINDILQDIEKYIPHNIEKYIPHNTEKIKSNILLPAYRIVTSFDFVIVASVITLLLAILLLPNASGYTQDEIDKNGIKDISVVELNQNSSKVTFDYCKNKYSRDSVGALVSSDLDSIPVPLAYDDIKYNHCATYGTKILAESQKVSVNLFENDDIDSLLSSFNTKVHDLQNKLLQIEQKIISNYNLNISSDELIKRAQLLEKQIKSAQSSIKILLAMNG